MRVLIRADASSIIGSGHVMRCLTLADALKLQGCHATFVCRHLPAYLEEAIRGRGHAIGLLTDAGIGQADADLAHSHWLGTSQEQDAVSVKSAAGQEPWDWVVVDHYALDARWERQLRSSARRVMVIDDLGDRQHDCDVLLDQNFRCDYDGLYDGLVHARCVKLLGPDYALLAPRYAQLRGIAKVRGTLNRLLIYLGGTSAKATMAALRAVSALNRADLIIDAVISPIFASDFALVNSENRNVTVHSNLTSLADLILAADLAIGAIGATTWERLCLGLPTIGLTVAANQVAIATDLHKAGLIELLGSIDMVLEGEISSAVSRLAEADALRALSTRCFAACDGLGSDRIVREMLAMSTIPR